MASESFAPFAPDYLLTSDTDAPLAANGNVQWALQPMRHAKDTGNPSVAIFPATRSAINQTMVYLPGHDYDYAGEQMVYAPEPDHMPRHIVSIWQDQGYDVIVPQLPRDISEPSMKRDLSGLIHEAINLTANSKTAWLGHSFGGSYLMHMLQKGFFTTSKEDQVLLLSTPRNIDNIRLPWRRLFESPISVLTPFLQKLMHKGNHKLFSITAHHKRIAFMGQQNFANLPSKLKALTASAQLHEFHTGNLVYTGNDRQVVILEDKYLMTPSPAPLLYKNALDCTLGKQTFWLYPETANARHNYVAFAHQLLTYAGQIVTRV